MVFFLQQPEWTKTLSKESINSLGSRTYFLNLDLPYKTQPFGLGISSDPWRAMNRTGMIKEQQSFGYCYGLNVCIPLEFMLKLQHPKVMVLVGGAFRRWLGHEDGVLMNWISVLIKESSLVPSTMWSHKKSAAQKRALTWPHWHHDPGLWASRTVRNQLLFISHPVCGISL